MKYYILLFLLSGCTKSIVQNKQYTQNIYGEVIKYCHLPILIDISRADSITQNASRRAIDNWNNSVGKTMFIISNKTKNKILNINSWNRLKNEQAFTRTNWSGSCINSVQIYVNNENFKYYIDHGYDNQYNLTSLLVHELGHVLGLSHSSYTGSVMDAYLDKLEDRNNPSKFDIDNITNEYFKKGDIL